jgi:hypothetical protein
MNSIHDLLYDLASIQTCLAQDMANDASLEITRVLHKLQHATALPESARTGAATLLLHAHDAVVRREGEHWRMAAARAVWQAFVHLHNQRRLLADSDLREALPLPPG